MMYKYLLTFAVTVVVVCLYLPKILTGLTQWSDRRWDRRQERYDWRKDKQDDRKEGRFWHREDRKSEDQDEENPPDGWRRFSRN